MMQMIGRMFDEHTYKKSKLAQLRHMTFLGHILETKRRFCPSWFKNNECWLEYSIAKDALFCLYCYLLKSSHGSQGGSDSFVGEGFRNWKKNERLKTHIGKHSSSHNDCMRKCQDLMM